MADARKVVLVTGASSGIGAAVADALTRAGYRVFGASRNPGAAPSGIETVVMDVDDDASVVAGVASVMGRTGRLDAVVNNAGWALMGPIEETAVAEARAQMETNFFGVLRVCLAVLPIMREQGGGHIVNISSLAGIFGNPFSGLYSASKFAVEGFSESLRFEARRFGVRVALVEPGDTQSRLPANRRTVKGSSPQSPYAAPFDRLQKAQAKDEASAPSPDRVARLVLNILASANPPMRQSVGMTGQRIVILLKRALPYSLFERIIAAALGV
jgi:NAD(P)-dependent dehydrogenase (short-subunit alcohol dehydrogenase family)